VGGVADSEKSACAGGAPVTARLKVEDWLRVPLVAVTVTFEFEVAAEAGAFTVSVELPEPFTETGLNDAVTPDGNPLTAKVTGAAKPF